LCVTIEVSKEKKAHFRELRVLLHLIINKREMKKLFDKLAIFLTFEAGSFFMGLLLLVLSFFQQTIHSQSSHYKFEHITPREGLSQSTVETILQDKKGFLWFGTNDGLNKYDGYSISVYRYSTKDPASISDNYIYEMIEDSEGFIWVGTSDGLNKYDPDINKFKHYINSAEDSTSITNNFVHTLCEDSLGNLWIGTMGGGLNFFRRYKEKFIRISITGKNPNKDVQKITSLLISRDNELFVGTYSGEVFYCNLNKYYKGFSSDYNNLLKDITFKKIKSSQYKDKTSENIVWSFIEDHDGNIWIGTSRDGLMRYGKTNKTITRINLNNSNKYSNDRYSILSLLEDPSGKIWIGTGGEGIRIFNPSSGGIEIIKSNEFTKGGLNDDSVWSLFKDRTGNYWIGTEFGGVNKFSPDRLKFDQLILPVSNPSIKSNFQVWAIYVDKNNIIWLGTENNGLIKYDQNNNQVEQFRHNSMDENSIGHNTVTTITGTPDGTLWIGTNGGGLQEFIPDQKRIIKYKNEEGNINSLSNNVIKDIYFDKNGNLWVGTYGGGINKLNPKTGEVRRIVFNNKALANQLDFISTLYAHSDSILWAGTYGNGLLKMNIQTYQTKLFKHDRNDIKSINNNRVVSIAEDEDGNLWIGTAAEINRYLPIDDSFEHYGVDDGLANGVIYAILADGKGNLWMSTNKGISKFNRKKKLFTNFTEEDGLQSYEFNRGAAFKVSNGRMYFGGINGVNVFHPDSIKINTMVPSIVITNIKVMNKVINYEYLVKKQGAIILPYDQKVISFEFAALDYKAPLKNQYAYYLENFDDDWIFSGARRLVTYTNLFPGKYVFHVKGTNSDGVWSEKEALILLIIEPPFYKTWWAYSIYVLAALGLLYFLRVLDLRRRRRTEEERLRKAKEQANLREAHLRVEMAESKTKTLEMEKELEKEQMRARIATDLHDEIGSNLSSIALISEMIGTRDDITPETGEAIENIKYTSRLSTERIRDIVWFINPMSDKLGDLMMRMEKSLSALSGKLNIKFTNDGVDEKRYINPEVKRNVYLIFREAVNNIAKHSNAKNVDIHFCFVAGKLKMFINDDGIGFNPNSGREGNGLTNMNQRAKQLNADFTVESSPGRGTSIKLILKIT
jgi:ligand-binding sensor domain-containing protein